MAEPGLNTRYTEIEVPLQPACWGQFIFNFISERETERKKERNTN